MRSGTVRRLLALLSMLLVIYGMAGPVKASFIVDFSFQLAPDGSEVNISEFNDNPILLEWGASWCSICERNQEAINEIYDDYSDQINFISLSFGGSDDSLQDVIDVKEDRGYNWTFGLDSNNYAAEVQIFNGYTWLLDTDLTILKAWNYTLVSSRELVEAFDTYLGISGTYSGSLPLTTFLIVTGSLLLMGLSSRRNLDA